MTANHNDRGQAIVDSVSVMLDAFDAWQQDAANFDIKPHSPLARAIEHSVLTVCYGDIPEQVRGIEIAVGRLRLAFEDYQGGEFRERTREPMPSFYAAMRSVAEAFRGCEQQTAQTTVIESVSELRLQKLNDEQIARAYGAWDDEANQWTGPFFDRHGRVQTALIQQEITQPGSVLGPAFQHPLDQIHLLQRERRLNEQAARFADRQETSKSEEARRIKPKPTRETVLQLLAEKLFPHQIQLDYDITMIEINAIAESVGVAVKTPEPYQPADSRLPLSNLDASPTSNVPESQVSLTERVKARTAEILASEPEATSHDIATRLSHEFGQQVKVVSVAAVMTNLKRRQQPQSA